VDALTGKARGILLRLPHFYAPDVAGPLLLDVAGAAGRTLERAEADLYRVLRAHHVQTADNEGAGGAGDPPGSRGELDRILGLYLDVLGGTSQLVRVSPALTARSVDARALGRMLLEPAYPLRRYLEDALPPDTWALLRRWDAAHAWFGAEEITPGLVLELLLAASPLAAYVAGRLDPAARALLAGYGGGTEVALPLRTALAEALNRRVLTDPHLYPRSAAVFDALPLSEPVVRLRSGVHGEFLRRRAAEAGAQEAERLRAALEWAEMVPSPAGDDLVRLNRQLLEAAWAHDPSARPWGLLPRGIPSPGEVRDALVAGLNAVLADPALARPENLEPEVAEELPALRQRFAGRPEWLGRTLLERSFPGAVEPAHAPYRERLLGLIQVLRRGASTRRGIVDVVAANLGLLGDDADARRARDLIQVREYAPRQVSFFRGAVQFWDEIPVTSSNRVATPAVFRVTMLPAAYAELTSLRLTHLESGEWVEWPGRMRAGDRLELAGSRVLLNGVEPAEALARPVPLLPPGPSRWRFEAEVVVPASPSDPESAWPVGRFDGSSGASAIFDRAVLAPEEAPVEVEVVSEEYTPGTFTVVIPWNIEGFTDRFDAEDHPRQQILGLVNRVRAAGVEGRVAYLERFREDQEPGDALRLEAAGRLLSERHDTAEAYRAFSRQRAAEDQAADDTLVLSGVFDHTGFDSLNTFA
jgi:hypothetical protein